MSGTSNRLVRLPYRVGRKISLILRDFRRARLRKRVAFTAPSPVADPSVGFSPHMLVCRQDLLLAVCSAKALNVAVGVPLPWVFHDDGSLTEAEFTLLATAFPGARVVRRTEADAYFEQHRDRWSRLHQARGRHVMLLKLADLHVFAARERILYVDSDILFFQKPEFLLSVLQNGDQANYFNRDLASAYITSLPALREFTGVQPLEAVNAGLSAINRPEISLDRIEKALGELDINRQREWYYYSHLIEQTIVATLTTAASSGARHLPEGYDVSLTKDASSSVCKHYVGAIRHDYEIEGLRLLLGQRDFLRKWQLFTTKR